MTDRVRALKLEAPSEGGTQTDMCPTEVNPASDALDAAGLYVQSPTSADTSVGLMRTASTSELQLFDAVNGTLRLAQLRPPIVTEVELDAGTFGVSEVQTTFADTNCTLSSRVVGSISGKAATNKDADETDMDTLYVVVHPQAGSVNVLVRGLDGNIHGTFKVAYTLAN